MSRAKGDLVVIDPDGVALPSAVIAFKEENGSTALAQALYAADSGGASTGSHLTTAKGELTRYAPFAQRANYRINGDTVNWPVDFQVAPEDVLALADDGLTMTSGYRPLARLRVAAMEAKMRDLGGFSVNLEAFAAGVTINNAQAAPAEATVTGTTPVGGDSTTAFQQAHAALVALGGGVLEIGPGTFFYPTSLTWANNIVWKGTKGKTVLMHRPNSEVLVNALGDTITGYQNVGFVDIEFNGNWEYNLDFTKDKCEVAFMGTDVFMVGCTVRNFNAFGIQVGGTRPLIAYNRVLGPNNGDGAASYANLHSFPNRYAGRDGIFTPGTLVVRHLLVHGNYVSGLRLPAIIVGGRGLTVTNNHVENCHRSYGFDAFGNETGGGQIAPCPTTAAGGGTQQCTDYVIANNTVGPSAVTFPGDVLTTTTKWANGIEINSSTDGLVANNTVYEQPAFGIEVNSTQRILIVGNSVRNSQSYGLNIHDDTSKFVVANNNFKSNLQGIHVGGTTNHFAIVGNIFEGQTGGNNFVNSASGPNYALHGNIAVDGAPLYNYTYNNYANAAASNYTAWGQVIRNDAIGTNGSNTGNGLWVIGGTLSSDFAFRVMNQSQGVELWNQFGNGQIQSTATVASAFAHKMVNSHSQGYGLNVQAGTDANQYAIHATDVTGSNVIMDLYASGQLDIGTGGANGQLLRIQNLTELTTIAAAATTDTAILMPAGAIILGVSVRVTTVIPTATSFSVGDSGSATRFSTANVGVAANSTDAGTKAGAYYNASALAVRLTMNGSNPAANTGRVRVTIHYYTLRPATS